MLLTMARTWDSLATERVAHIERQKRMAAIEETAARGSDSHPLTQCVE
jgi:hypothetical protein